MSMSREDDFDDILDSPDESDAGQDDTSEPLMEESEESSVAGEIELDMPAVQETPRRPPKAPAKKKTAKKKTAKKKTAAVTRKPAPKKTVAKKKTAKKKTQPAAKKKKTARKKPRRR